MSMNKKRLNRGLKDKADAGSVFILEARQLLIYIGTTVSLRQVSITSIITGKG
jgi:hypothetical protein